VRASALFVLVCLGGSGLQTRAEPVTIRVGDGFAVEEQIWLMKAMPSVTPNQGKIYNIDLIPFRGADMRFAAFEAGQIDMGTGGAQAVILAASQGADLRIIASISREQEPGFVTHYMSLTTMPFGGLADMKGKIIGTNAANSSIVVWAQLAAAKAGLNPTRDVRFAVVPFPTQGEAVRSGKLDIGAFPQPFAANEIAKGGLKTVFTSKTGAPFPEELNVLIASPEFLHKHPDVVRAYLSDFVATTHYYLAHPREARQALIDAKAVSIPADLYVNMDDNYHQPDARIDLDALEKDQTTFLDMGFQKKKINLREFVDMSYLPR
jgi:ABC-type nitrate/sulfonate/bicarbonate transport system substrate-binding protein